MKLNVEKTLTNGEFKVDISFKNYEIFEEGLIEDFGTPEVKIPVSTWGGTISNSEGKITITDIE